MQKRFEYNSRKDWEAPNKQKIYLTQISGIIIVILGIGYFSPVNKEAELWKIIVGLITIIVGIIHLLFPLKMLKPTLLQNEFITINKEKISWKQGVYDNLTELKIDEIENVKIYIGEIHFEMETGQIHKLKSHKIHNEKKRQEFIERINSQIRNKIKNKASR